MTAAAQISENFLAPTLGMSGHGLPQQWPMCRVSAGIEAHHRIESREASITAAQDKRQAHRLADPLEVLTARAEARAYLWSVCEILDLLDAVDPLQDYAERSGLVDTLGQDHVQHLIASAFAPYRGDLA